MSAGCVCHWWRVGPLRPPHRELATLPSRDGRPSTGQPVRLSVLRFLGALSGSYGTMLMARLLLPSQLDGKHLQGWRQRGPNPVFPLPCCVTLSESPNASVPLSSLVKGG